VGECLSNRRCLSESNSPTVSAPTRIAFADSVGSYKNRIRRRCRLLHHSGREARIHLHALGMDSGSQGGDRPSPGCRFSPLLLPVPDMLVVYAYERVQLMQPEGMHGDGHGKLHSPTQRCGRTYSRGNRLLQSPPCRHFQGAGGIPTPRSAQSGDRAVAPQRTTAGATAKSPLNQAAVRSHCGERMAQFNGHPGGWPIFSVAQVCLVCS
jgi:hypothetical protein